MVAGSLAEEMRWLWGWWELRKSVQSDELVGGGAAQGKR